MSLRSCQYNKSRVLVKYMDFNPIFPMGIPLEYPFVGIPQMWNILYTCKGIHVDNLCNFLTNRLPILLNTDKNIIVRNTESRNQILKHTLSHLINDRGNRLRTKMAFSRVIWLAQSVEVESLDLRVESSSPMVGLELTLKKGIFSIIFSILLSQWMCVERKKKHTLFPKSCHTQKQV